MLLETVAIKTQAKKRPVERQTRQTENHQLALHLTCDNSARTVLQHRYMAYPLSVSPIFRLEENGTATSQNRAYLYRMNTSPGLLATDRLGVSLQLEADAQLYLADQSATKVHTMPQAGDRATVTYEVKVGDRATLEFLPEPLILFAEAALTQTTNIELHPGAGLSWGEIVLPGRLARGECYEFREFFSRICVKSPEGSMRFTEAMKLLGKQNPFAQSALFASGPVLGTLLLILPETVAMSQSLAALGSEIDEYAANYESVELATSVMPGECGLFIRAMSATTRDMQACFKAAVNSVRRLRQASELPYSL